MPGAGAAGDPLVWALVPEDEAVRPRADLHLRGGVDVRMPLFVTSSALQGFAAGLYFSPREAAGGTKSTPQGLCKKRSIVLKAQWLRILPADGHHADE